MLNIRRDRLKKNRVSTTISEKHWALLKKHAEKYSSQQKVLELALECLENNSKQPGPLSPEEELWTRIGCEVKSACIIQKDALKELLRTTDTGRLKEIVASDRPAEYVIEYYYQKPLKECTLKEVVEGIVINGKMAHWFDTINYTDDGDRYTIKITHDMGINNSIVHKILNESVFNTYGVRTESEISERSLFIKVFKNGK